MEFETVFYNINDEVILNNDAYTIVDPLWWSVSIYDGEDNYKKDLKKFTTEQKYVFAIEWYMAEVNNGGHNQFYYNSAGLVWEDAMQGFKEVGLLNNYEIIKESANRLGGNPSKDRHMRQDQLEEYDAEFDDLDNKFYESSENIEVALIKYIRANKEKFYYSGSLMRPKF